MRLFLALLSIAAVTSSMTIKNDTTTNVKFNACPRDCICTPLSSPTIARCNRLEVKTQVFGSDITDLIIENAAYPMALTSKIFVELGLQELSNIRISNSTLTEIAPDAFVGMSSLYSVKLSGNKLKHLDPLTFKDNDEMYLLSLSDNPLVFSSENFLKSATIQELDISKCNISTLPPATFSQMSGLLYINLAGNKMTELNPDVFSELTKIEEIDFSDNLIETVSSNLFSENSEITTLSFKNNPLSSFSGLNVKELLSLDISHGSLKLIGPSTFEGMYSISNLALNNNGIQKIFSLAFSKLAELSYLDLSNNDLEFISDQIIKQNKNLDVFKIANNTRLKKLPAKGFAINGSNFEINLFDASGCSLEFISDTTFETMPDLTQLFLSRNKINAIGSFLYRLKNLRELDLSKNLIKSLDVNTFSVNSVLRKVNLAGNPLIWISSTLFSKNSLTWLDISSCQLKKLWKNTGSTIDNGLSKLTYLNVSDNQMLSVEVKDLKTLQGLKTLDVSNNPLQCDDDFENLMFWVGENKVSPYPQDEMIANLEMNPKVNVDHVKWQSLAKEVCGQKLDIISPNKALDIDSDEDNDDDEDEDEEDDEYYYDNSDEDVNKIDNTKIPIESTSTKKSDKNIETITERTNIFSDMKEKNLLDDPNFIKSIVNEPSLESDIRINELMSLDHEPNENSMDIEIERTKEFNYDDFRYEIENTQFNHSQSTIFVGSYEYTYSLTWRIGLIAIIALLLCMILRMCRMKSNLRQKCSVITVTGSHGRVKTDCGLVYQQLSEDLKSPRTPIIRKHGLVSNLTKGLEETKGLKSPQNFPEAV